MEYRIYREQPTGKRMVYVIRNVSVARPYNTEHFAYLDSESNICIRNGSSFIRIADILGSRTHKIITRYYK